MILNWFNELHSIGGVDATEISPDTVSILRSYRADSESEISGQHSIEARTIAVMGYSGTFTKSLRP